MPAKTSKHRTEVTVTTAVHDEYTTVVAVTTVVVSRA